MCLNKRKGNNTKETSRMLSYRSVCVWCSCCLSRPVCAVWVWAERRRCVTFLLVLRAAESVSPEPSVNVQRSRTADVKPQVGLWPEQAALQRLGSGVRKQLGCFYTISSARFDYESMLIWLIAAAFCWVMHKQKQKVVYTVWNCEMSGWTCRVTAALFVYHSYVSLCLIFSFML